MFAVKTRVATPAARSVSVKASSGRPLWFPGATPPAWLDGSAPGDRGFDPMGFSANTKAAGWYKQSELVHGRWAMLGVAGILVQELVHPEIFWYESGLPQNIPGNPLIGDPVNPGGLLAWEFVLMHFVEVLRWQDYRNPGSVNRDPIFTNNAVTNPETGYPGFDPIGLSKGNFNELKTKELKNGRLAMVAFVGFVFAAQTTGKGPLAALTSHLSSPFSENWTQNIGHCVTPSTADVGGLVIPLTCLWPGH